MFYRRPRKGDIEIIKNIVISGTYEEFNEGGDLYNRITFYGYFFDYDLKGGGKCP